MLWLAAGCGGPGSMNESTQNVKHITAAEFDPEVVQAVAPVVVDFYATWCGPCKMLSPRIDQMAGAFTNRVKFVKINFDQASSLAQRFSVEAVPTLLLFREGKVVDTLIGVPDPEILKSHLDLLARAPSEVGGK